MSRTVAALLRGLTTMALLLSVACGYVGDFEVEEICSNGHDDDKNGHTDCADEACAAHCVEQCSNGWDDDGDGAIDCADSDCEGRCAELCDDGLDNDSDGAIDCADRDCVGSCPESCADALDNDGDGLVDCLDSDCSEVWCPERCDDGADNDADGRIDCDDTDCVGHCPEDCHDDVDNDGDGLKDCDDYDCIGFCAESCDDGLDNDGDGRTDCDDTECQSICDQDGDGFVAIHFGGLDCDDRRPEVNPAAREVCNDGRSLDDDCDGQYDDNDPSLDLGTATEWGLDEDGDGFGGSRVFAIACDPPADFAELLDCNDADAEVHPLAPELCNSPSPIDDDCNGVADDDDAGTAPESMTQYYLDVDGDGLGDDAAPLLACLRPEGASDVGGDCDDGDDSVGSPTLWFADGDDDGYGWGLPADPVPSCDSPVEGWVADWHGLDCDDADPMVSPGAAEVCGSGLDEDCDGVDSECGIFFAGGRDGDGIGAAPDHVFGVVDLASGTWTRIAESEMGLTGLAFGPDGALYGVEASGRAEQRIVRVSISDGRTVALATVDAGAAISGIAFDARGELHGYSGWTGDIGPLSLVDGSFESEWTGLRHTGAACLAGGEGDTLIVLAGDHMYSWQVESGTLEFVGSVDGRPRSLLGSGCTLHEGDFFHVTTEGVLYRIPMDTLIAEDTGIRLPASADSLAGNGG